MEPQRPTSEPPLGVTLTAVLILVLSLTGLAAAGWIALHIALPDPTDVPPDSRVGAYSLLIVFAVLCSFGVWTAIGLLSLSPNARAGTLFLAQSLISIGLTSGLVCLYLSKTQDIDGMNTASIILFLIAAVGSFAKIYFRLPSVASSFRRRAAATPPAAHS